MPFFPQGPGLLPPFAHIAGGPFVMGSTFFEDATPHWVHVSPFRMGVTCVTEYQFRKVMKLPYGYRGKSDDHPVTEVTWEEAAKFMTRLDEKLVRVGFPTEAEWEFAARGPTIDIRDAMREEGIAVGDFVDFVKDRFENFVERIEMGSRILTDPTDKDLRRILKTKNSLFAWRVYGTPLGRLTDNEVRRSVNEERKGIQAADWGPANAYGLKGMMGGVLEWVGDWFRKGYYQEPTQKDPMGPERVSHKILRGGPWSNREPDILRVACRSVPIGPFLGNYGFRLAAAHPDSFNTSPSPA